MSRLRKTMLVAPLAFGLGGCASLAGFPEPVLAPDAGIAEVAPQLSPQAVIECSATPSRLCRNVLIDARLRASNIRFNEFERRLYRQGVGAGIGTDWATLAANVAGTIRRAAAPQLSALSAMLVGGRASYQKQALYDMSLPVLMAQMVAKRQEVLVRIRAGQARDIGEYSLYRGLDDLDDYERAGSIPAAMSEMVRNAGTQASAAQEDLRQITQVEIVEPAVQARREAIARRLKAARPDDLHLFAAVSEVAAGTEPLVASLEMLEAAREPAELDRFCARLRLAVPFAGPC